MKKEITPDIEELLKKAIKEYKERFITEMGFELTDHPALGKAYIRSEQK
jgi:hypothetical protein